MNALFLCLLMEGPLQVPPDSKAAPGEEPTEPSFHAPVFLPGGIPTAAAWDKGPEEPTPQPGSSAAGETEGAVQSDPKQPEHKEPKEGPEHTPTEEEKSAALSVLLQDLQDQVVPASYSSEAPRVRPLKFEGASITVLCVKSHARVAGRYVRIMDVAAFVHDPEGTEPFLGPVILCPSPEFGQYLTISRALITQRIREYGVPLDKVAVTGAAEVLVLRTKAQGPEGDKKRQAIVEEKLHVQKDQQIRILRKGRFFRLEQWGEALQSGSAGDIITVKDRKGRTLRGQVVGKQTVEVIPEATAEREKVRESTIPEDSHP